LVYKVGKLVNASSLLLSAGGTT